MTSDLLDRFFKQARDVHLGDRDKIELSPDELAELVSNEVLGARFRSRFKLEAQDPELRSLITLYLKGVAAKEEELAEEFRIDADGIDKYVGRVGVGASGAGIATIAATAGVGAFMLLGGGLIALAVSGLASHRLRRRALKRNMLARRIRELLEELDDD